MTTLAGIEELSTSGSETPPSPPTPSRFRPSLAHSLSARAEQPHQVQCACDQSLSAVFAKHFSFWAAPNQSPPSVCSRLQPWVSRSLPKRATPTYTSLLLSSIETKEHQSNLHQIDLDLSRTYPDEPYFSEGGGGREALRRVLTAFSNYDPSLGYVQGMNFIAAALLWHAGEVESFWLLVHLMEEYDMRDNYTPELPGLTKHSQIVNLVLMEHLPKLHLLFCRYRIASELFVTDWCFTMFGSLVPLGDMGRVLEAFLEGGWSFFYKLVLVILGRLQSRLLQSIDISELLSSLRPPNKSQRRWREFVGNLEHGKESLSWVRLLEEAALLKIDDGYIQRLHFGFRLDTSRFGRLE